MSDSDPQPDPQSTSDLLGGLDPGELLARGLQTAKLSADATAWVAPDPEKLAKLLPQYQIECLLGRGGMGAVYKGLQNTLERPVAIKLLPADLAADEIFVTRFEREARILAKLQHPDIVGIYEFGKTSAGHLFFVMEYVDGTDLKKILDTTGLDFEQALLVVSRICEALHAAHQQGVVHRDIKPANVLITKNGDVKLADFGLARPVHENAEGLTATNVVMGTPQYMAPEQHQGHADCRTDIFALGVMLYEMLTGQTPRGFFEPPSRKVQVDVRIDNVVLKALQEEPSRRYQHASEMGTDVDQIRKSSPPQTMAEPAAQPAPAPPSRNRNRILFASVAALAAGIIFLSAIALLSTKKDRSTASAGATGATAPDARSDSPPPVIKSPAKPDATPFSRIAPSTPVPHDLAPRSAATATPSPQKKSAPSSTISPVATPPPRIVAPGAGSLKPDLQNGGAATAASHGTPKPQSSPTPTEDALFERALVNNVWSWIPGVSSPHESELIFHQDGSVLCANASGRWKIGGHRNVTLSFQATPVVLNFDETVQRFTGFSEGARSIVFTGALKRSATQPAATPPSPQMATAKKESPAPSVEQAPKSTPNPQPKDGFYYTTGFEAPIFPAGKFRKANATAVGDGHWSVLPEGALEVDRAVRIQNTVSHGGSQALMIDAGPGKAIQMEVIGSFENSEPFVSIQADIFLQSSSKQSDWDISFGDPEIGGHLQAGGFNIFGGNGHLQIMTDGYPQNMTTFPRDTWTHIELRMNVKTQSFDILFNGSPVATKVPFIAHTSRIRHFILGDFAHGNDRMYIDNFSFTATKAP